eukprot:s2507_g11.t1
MGECVLDVHPSYVALTSTGLAHSAMLSQPSSRNTSKAVTVACGLAVNSRWDINGDVSVGGSCGGEAASEIATSQVADLA